MSINNFIPVIWSANMLMNLHKAQIWGQPGVANTDYEGDIKQAGDAVRINAIGPVTLGTYAKNTNIGDPQTLQDASSVLPIDQSKYFNFAIDDVDKAQGKPSVMGGAMTEAAYSVSNDADTFLAALVAGVAAANLIGSDGSPKSDTAPSSGISKAYDYLVDLGVLLSNANVPKQGRWAIVPPWYYGLLQKDDRFVRYGTPQQSDVIQNGVIGKAAGFTVMESNNVLVTNTNVYNITAGFPGALTYANQISEVEAYRPEKRFADAVKGLHLYGGKLVRPQGIAVLKATDPGF